MDYLRVMNHTNKKCITFYLCINVLVSRYEFMNKGTHRSQTHQIPLSLHLQVVVSLPKWELGTELRSPESSIAEPFFSSPVGFYKYQ